MHIGFAKKKKKKLFQEELIYIYYSLFLGLTLMLPFCGYVDVFEFVPSARMSSRCHYFDDMEDPSCTLGVWHPLSAEKFVTLAMNELNDSTVFETGFARVRGFRNLNCWLLPFLLLVDTLPILYTGIIYSFSFLTFFKSTVRLLCNSLSYLKFFTNNSARDQSLRQLEVYAWKTEVRLLLIKEPKVLFPGWIIVLKSLDIDFSIRGETFYSLSANLKDFSLPKNKIIIKITNLAIIQLRCVALRCCVTTNKLYYRYRT